MWMPWKPAIAALAVVAIISTVALAHSHKPAMASSAVKIETASGHGSGVHIGHGFIITAAHVASTGEVTIKTDDGKSRAARVLWASMDRDIALLATSPDGIANSDLNCTALYVGQPITAMGNPMDVEFVSTSGRVAGAPRVMGDWKVGVPVDMTVLPGMSGGPVLDTSGRVAGISVGVATSGIAASPTGLGVIVPASVVCELLAR